MRGVKTQRRLARQCMTLHGFQTLKAFWNCLRKVSPSHRPAEFQGVLPQLIW